MHQAISSTDGTDGETTMQRVLDVIRNRIVSGEVPADAVLNQSVLARELEVSRIPVRDAFRVLAAEGLLSIANGQGRVTSISVAELQEIYEIREALEPLATRIGLSNVGRAQIIVMERLMEQMHDAGQADDFRTWLDANASFHRQIYAQSNRWRMIQTIDRLTRETDRYLWLHRDSWVKGEVDDEHGRILEAARANDGDAVEATTLEHLRNAHDLILRRMLHGNGAA
jgi:DNA-binding GntR family transcriptional regulator